MSQLRYLNCLLFVVHSEEPPAVWKSPASPLDQAKIRETIKLYALLPCIPEYPEEYEILRSNFANCSVTLINNVVECPLVLTSAIREDRTEVVEALLDVKHTEYEELIVKVDIFNEELVNALLAEPFIVKGMYSRYDMILPHPYSNYDSRSVFEEANHPIFELLASFRADLRYRHKKGGTLLHFAVRNHYEPLVRLLLRNGAQPEARTLEGLTPLHVAVEVVRTPASIVDLLIQHGANVNCTVTESDDTIPLYSALFRWNCRPDVIKSLLENGARKDHKCLVDNFQKLAIESKPECLDCYLSYRPHLSVEVKRETLRAVLKGSVPRKRTVEVLLKYDFELVPEDARNTEVFFGAVSANSLELVQKLLSWGASVNARTEKGLTPLHAAVRDVAACEEIIQVLLDHGADINAKMNWGATPLSLAVSGKLETLTYLLANGARVEDDPTILHKVVFCVWDKNCPAKVKLLLENGADVNYRDERDETPLSCAAFEGNKKIFDILSRYGAFIDSTDKRIHDALLCHIEEGRWDILQELVQMGANLQGLLEEAFLTAVTERRRAVVRLLLKFHDPLALTVNMSNILKQAIHTKDPNILQDILTYGCLSIRSIAVDGVFDGIKTICRDYDTTTSSYLLRLRADALDCADAVCSHISAVQAANLSINREGVDYELPDWVLESESFYSPEDCQVQVAAMKNTTIGESGVSFFDILNASEPKIVRFLKDERLVNILKRGRYGFPIYDDIILSRYHRASYRRSLVVTAIKAMNILSIPFRGLSLEVKEIIFDYLSNQNLLVLSKVWTLPIECRP